MNPVTERRWPAVMVDLETLGTSDDAAILEIGAVCFDLESRTKGPRFGVTIPLTHGGGRRIDPDTLSWWMDQWREGGIVPDLNLVSGVLLSRFDRAMENFYAFWERHAGPEAEFWSRGSFDDRILCHALKQAKLIVPWHFYKVRDQRSVLDWEGVRPRKAAHGALEDAVAQVEDLFRAAGRRQDAVAGVRSEQSKGEEYGEGWRSASNAFADLVVMHSETIDIQRDGAGEPDSFMAKFRVSRGSPILAALDSAYRDRFVEDEGTDRPSGPEAPRSQGEESEKTQDGKTQDARVEDRPAVPLPDVAREVRSAEFGVRSDEVVDTEARAAAVLPEYARLVSAEVVYDGQGKCLGSLLKGFPGGAKFVPLILPDGGEA